MSYFFFLLLGGLIAAAWLRIDKLERKVANFARKLDGLQHATQRDDPVQADDGAVPATRATPATSLAIPPGVVPDPAPEPVAHVSSAPEFAPEPTFEGVETVAYASAPEDVVFGAARRGFSFDFEDIFGRRLPIWGGGFALAIAGIFLVRFSIEAGLLTPAVRVSLSFVFGLALLAGAETAYRFDARLEDPRVRQALAGAGLATLYGAFYLAGKAYGLIGAGTAFVGLACVTAAAIGLSFRFGLPSAVIGLVGGFAAPLLVDSDSANVPLLSFYLALITGGLAWSGEVQSRRWLSYAALAAGLGWGVLMMIAGVSSSSDLAALGVYLVLLGTVLPAFLHAKGGPSLPHLVAGGLATLQMAVLVTDAGFAPLTWGLYLLIAAALAGLGWRFEALRLGTLVAAGLGLWLLMIWPEADPPFFVLVAAVQVAIFCGVPIAYQWLGQARLLDRAQLGAVSLLMGIVVYARFANLWSDTNEPLLAACMAGLALLPGAAFALAWRCGEQGDTRSTLILIAPTALLVFAALLLISPAWLAPAMAAAVAGPLVWCYARRDTLALHSAAWAGAGATLITLAVTPGFADEFTQLGEFSHSVIMLRAAIRWAAAAAPFAAMAVIARPVLARAVAEAFAVSLTYGLIAQLVPSAPLAWIAAAGSITLFLMQPARIAAWTSALVIASAWALMPLATWATAALLALMGDPFMAGSAVSPVALALRIAPIAAVLIVMAWKWQDQPSLARAPVLLGFGIIGAVMFHSLFKQVFAITSLFQFDHYGMGERTIWQALLAAAAYAAGQGLPTGLRRPVSLGLIAAGLAHFGWFTLILHNPLMQVQHVGPTPIANWLTLAYFTAMAGLWLGSGQGQGQWGKVPVAVHHGIDAAMMALIALLAFSLLRQIFAGSVLAARAVGQTESLLMSLLGIVLALGFLWWGSRHAARNWRIGSLVLMLAAVIKVFLIDAAALEGLLRIASFMALGFSLIGIGWVYSRQLSRRSLPPAEAA